MDVTSIAGAYQGLKAVKDILTGAIEAKDDVDAKAKILEAQIRLGEIQDTLFGLREQLSELQDQKRQLQEQLVAAQAWNEKLNQYELTKTVGGAIVYNYKGDPKHFACPTCINKQEIQILQDNRTMSGKYRCTGCANEFPIEQRQY